MSTSVPLRSEEMEGSGGIGSAKRIDGAGEDAAPDKWARAYLRLLQSEKLSS